MAAAAPPGVPAVEGAPTHPQNKLVKSNPLSRRLQKILNTSLDDPDTQDAAEYLADFYSEDHDLIATRNELRTDVEKQIGLVNRRFMDAYGSLNEPLQLIEDEVKRINTSFDDLQGIYGTAKERTANLLIQMNEIKGQCAQASSRKLIAEAFLQRFTLSDKEVAALTSPSVGVGNDFFDALKQLQQINDECKALLVTENQTAGMEIMESLSVYQESAYEKLFRWAQHECRAMNREIPDLTPAFRDAMSALRQRPVLFQTCIDEIAHVRRPALVRFFIDALTVGGPGGMPRPIEIHAHDHLRYVGDMLAWLHEAAANERELLEGLFNINTDARRKVESTAIRGALVDDSVLGEVTASGQAVLTILNKNLEGTVRPLRVRVEQVISAKQTSTSVVTTYKLAQLVQFYCGTITRVVGKDAQLAISLSELGEMANKTFREVLVAQGQHFLRQTQAPPQDLQPPYTLKEAASQIREILSTYSAGLTSDSDDDGFHEILRGLVEPLVRMCMTSATTLGAVLDQAIFLVNCLFYIHGVLRTYRVAVGLVDALEAQVEGQIEILVVEQYQALLKQSGIALAIETMEENRDQVPLSLLPHMDAHSLTDVFAKFDLFLCSAHLDLAASLSRLVDSNAATAMISPSLAIRPRSGAEPSFGAGKSSAKHQVAIRGLRMFIEAYRRLYDAVMDPANKYDWPASIVVRTVADVETLLAVEDDL
ncbi:oligomeric complex COG6-domain-containing protein, partial [Cladochytrium replicatum]